jgi:hypothetical protein
MNLANAVSFGTRHFFLCQRAIIIGRKLAGNAADEIPEALAIVRARVLRKG